jgi:hypothetical protein
VLLGLTFLNRMRNGLDLVHQLKLEGLCGLYQGHGYSASPFLPATVQFQFLSSPQFSLLFTRNQEASQKTRPVYNVTAKSRNSGARARCPLLSNDSGITFLYNAFGYYRIKKRISITTDTRGN